MTQGNRAAIDVHLAHVGVVDLGPREDDRGEGFVDFDDIEILHRHLRLLQDQLRRIDRAVEQVVGVRADADVGDDAGARLEAEGLRLFLAHPEDGRGTIGNLRGVTGGGRAAFLQGSQAGQAFQRGRARALVTGDHTGLAGGLAIFAEDGSFDRQDFAVEMTGFPGGGGLALRFKGEEVDVFALEATLLDHALDAGELLARHVIRPAFRVEVAGAAHDVHAQADTAHGFNTAGDADIERAALDHGGDHGVGLLGRTALRINGGCPGRKAFVEPKPGITGQIVGLFTGLRHATGDDLFDVGVLETITGDQAVEQLGEQDDGMNAGEFADDLLAARNRGTDGIDDDCFTHIAFLSVGFVRVSDYM